MTNSQRLDQVRQHLAAIIRDDLKNSETETIHFDEAALARETDILRESILIRDEFFCGRRFQTANFHAIWFIEQNELKVFKGRTLLTVLSSDQIEVAPAIHQPAEVFPAAAIADAESEATADDAVIIRLPTAVSQPQFKDQFKDQSEDQSNDQSNEQTVRRAA